MVERKIIHATLVQMDGKGILLTGKSGSGKSDLALRLIENKAAKLVADDMVEIFERNSKILGNAPKNMRGLLEVRGVGIVKYPCLKNAQIDMVVNLKDKPEDVERMPIIAKDIILGLEINKIDLYAKENSAPEKIAAALRKFGQDAVS
ncbi:MAG: HPr kinase/phosphatase C-terminal domain-containing protein [Alphaproteobacteria bacterium]|nr:HPr kinase/phosphatase C-terminal domain-containing protein [Alphaproteobacteria bacterium]